jgi:hypothetical protein
MVSEKIPSKLTNKTCKQVSDLVFGYLNDQLSPRIKRDFERHLDLCPDCVAFLKTYKKTIQASRTVNPAIIPVKVRNSILTFLRKQIRRVGAIILCYGAHFFA